MLHHTTTVQEPHIPSGDRRMPWISVELRQSVMDYFWRRRRSAERSPSRKRPSRSPQSSQLVKYRVSSESPGRGSIAILFLGKSGSGKSSLVAALSSQKVDVEHSLSSGTERLQTFNLSRRHGTAIGYDDVVLVDTPSFDNSAMGDDAVLEEIRSGLQKLHEKNIPVASIVYTHRVTDTRMNGSARKSLDLCKAICGYNAAPRLAFVTTGWDVVETDEVQERGAIERESTLARDFGFWGDFMEKGSHMFRSHGPQRSALKVLKKLHINPCAQKLQLLDEYHNFGSLSQTSAYGVLMKSLESSIIFTTPTHRPRAEIDDEAEEDPGLPALTTRPQYDIDEAQHTSRSWPQDIHQSSRVPVHDYYQQKFRMATPPYRDVVLRLPPPQVSYRSEAVSWADHTHSPLYYNRQRTLPWHDDHHRHAYGASAVQYSNPEWLKSR
jgi:GTPase SAR1 family protein